MFGDLINMYFSVKFVVVVLNCSTYLCFSLTHFLRCPGSYLIMCFNYILGFILTNCLLRLDKDRLQSTKRSGNVTFLQLVFSCP